MKKVFVSLTLLTLFALPAFAQTPAPAPQEYSLLNPIRLSVGARVYREWNVDSNFNVAQAPDWRIGVPLAWQITALSGEVKHPFSITGAADYGLSSQTWRFQVGGTFGLKLAGH